MHFTPYKFRVFLQTRTGDPVDVDSVVAWLKQVSPDHLLIIQHGADADDSRPHFHALFFCERPVQSLRVALVKAVPSVSKQYSLQVMPDDAVTAYTRYMCHGESRGDDVHIVYTSLAKYSQQWAAGENRAFWDARKAFKQDQSKKNEDILSHCIELAKTQNLRTVREIGAMLLDEYQSRKKTFHVNHMRHQILTIWHAVGGVVQKREVLDHILGGCENFSPIGITHQCLSTLGGSDLDALLDA